MDARTRETWSKFSTLTKGTVIVLAGAFAVVCLLLSPLIGIVWLVGKAADWFTKAGE